ncbi:hypothetical protein [Natroniella sp. ANB-PHB2]|uniref:hypothetical protein n=1 Tax=Natroniella sp. ANB-PHB2 TaxID=3384444 RepID=UPI0038D4ECB1
MTVRVEDDDKKLEQLFKELEYLSSHVILVGVLADDKADTDDEVTVKDYAIWLEFGDREYNVHYPPRPFFREATQTEEARDKIEDKMEEELQQVIDLKKTAKQAMDAVGTYVQGLVQESILDGDWADNAPATIAIKGKNQPLIQTTTLLKSIDYEIKKRSELQT